MSREKTIENADHITPNLDEFLYVNKLPRNISYPKNRIKIPKWNGIEPQNNFLPSKNWEDKDDTLNFCDLYLAIVPIKNTTKAMYGKAIKKKLFNVSIFLIINYDSSVISCFIELKNPPDLWGCSWVLILKSWSKALYKVKSACL